MITSIDRLGDMVRVKFSLSGVDDEQWFLLRSDAHHDSAQADNKLEKQHLEQAAERDAAILDFGDLFDAMQSPHDRRRSMGGRKSDHMLDAYFNEILDDAEKFYGPYAERIILLARGNHGSTVVVRYFRTATVSFLSVHVRSLSVHVRSLGVYICAFMRQRSRNPLRHMGFYVLKKRLKKIVKLLAIGASTCYNKGS